MRRAINEKEKLESELARVHFELERVTSQHAKAQINLEKIQEDYARKQVHFHANPIPSIPILTLILILQVEYEMTAEKYERNLLELRRVQGECDRYRQDCESQKEEVSAIQVHSRFDVIMEPNIT